MYKYIIWAALLLSGHVAIAQDPTTHKDHNHEEMLIGLVTDAMGEPLYGATVLWENTEIGTVADLDGNFELPRQKGTKNLIVRYVGYDDTSVEILPEEESVWIEVAGVSALSEVEIEAKVFDSSVSTLDTRNVESIGRKELLKAPCCNLSESFETNGSVDVTYANAVTGVREIQMLGLKGVYSQFTLENRPTLYGIATPYAFEFLPGTWVEGIQIAKGASTVKNGYQGFTGQINVELEKPLTSERPRFLNAYMSSGGRGEVNLHLNKKGKGRISNGIYLHASGQESPFDHNDDNFYDMLNRRQLNGMYRSMIKGEGWMAQVNVQALTDSRTGGMIEPLADGSDFPFSIDNDRLEVWAKGGFTNVNNKPYNSIGNIISASYHRTNGIIGSNNYTATQRSMYWQSLFHTILGNSDHQIEFAPTLTIDDYDEQLNEGDLSRQEIIPGAMTEYSYNHSSLRMNGAPDFSIVLGLRADYHSIFGTLVTPRLSTKYNFNENTVIRFSAGRGYRSPSVIAENISVLATNRAVDFTKVTKPEEAWNFGLNFTKRFKIAKKETSIALDAFRTDFIRQLLLDQETDISRIQLYYTEEKAYSNSLMATFQIEPIKGFDLKFVYKYNDVQSTFADGELKAMPFVAKHRGLVALDYNTPNKKWMFNISSHIIGPQRIPDQSAIPHQYTHHFPSMSPSFATFNAQITRKWDDFEIYIGGENLGSYTQHQLIMAAEEPTSPFFNGSLVYAPSFGRMGYLGVRWNM